MNSAKQSCPSRYLLLATRTCSQSVTIPFVALTRSTSIARNTSFQHLNRSSIRLSTGYWYGYSSEGKSSYGFSVNFDLKSQTRIRRQVPSSLLLISNKLLVQTANLN